MEIEIVVVLVDLLKYCGEVVIGVRFRFGNVFMVIEDMVVYLFRFVIVMVYWLG